MDAYSTSPADASYGINTSYELPSPTRRYEAACQAAAQGRALLAATGDELTARTADYLCRDHAAHSAGERRSLACADPLECNRYMLLADETELHQSLLPDLRTALRRPGDDPRDGLGSAAAALLSEHDKSVNRQLRIAKSLERRGAPP